jgi:hypothetical protein
MSPNLNDGFRDSDERVAAQKPMGYTPGDLEDRESAEAFATRTGQQGTASRRPASPNAEEQSEQQAARHQDRQERKRPEDQPDERRPIDVQPPLGTVADPFR